MLLEDKVAIITGAGSGIGRAMAILFAQKGAKVVVVDIDRDCGQETVDLIWEGQGEAIFVECNVSDASQVQAMVETALKAYNRLDILVNNAGVFIPGTVAELEAADWERVLNVNLSGAYLCSKYAIPVMLSQGGGTILNVASTAGLTGGYRRAAYAASKGGLIALTKSMALDHSGSGIRVNCLCPGPVDTAMLRSGMTAPDLAEVGKYLPIGRVADPAEVASVALFLVSEAASCVTGAIWTVDGGESLA